MSHARKFFRVLGGIVAGLALTVGVLILLRLVLPENAPAGFRWVAGSAMVLYGVYRSLWFFSVRREESDRDETNVREPSGLTGKKQ